MSHTIRERTAADMEGCLELLLRVRETDGYPIYLPPDRVPAFFDSEHTASAWVAVDDGRIVGHVALLTPPDEPTLVLAHETTGLPLDQLILLARLFVDPDHRRSGLGRALLHHARAAATAQGRRAVLDVGHSLQKAVALYEAEGWQRVGELHLPLDDTMLDLWVYVSPST